jgi:hypothetical protein
MAPPINEPQAHAVKTWMTANFGAQLAAAVQGTPFDDNLLCAIAGKEAACYWLAWTRTMAPAEVLARCVFDASGDAPNTSRSAFPRNTAQFRAQYGDALTDMLIAEANAARQLRNLGPAQWVYKGYGIFQYDLQYITADRGFFADRRWGDFGECVTRAVRELSEKYAHYQDLRSAVRAYNGSGPAAEAYADDVMQLLTWCSEV